MLNFVELLSDILNEKNKTFKDLEDNNIISKRTYYQYKTFTPFLEKILKILNYLNVSLDYFTDRSQKNNFKPYKIPQRSFYDNLNKLMKSENVSQSQLSKDLNIGRSNFSYWKNGTLPKFSTIVDLANYLNCSIDDLLEREDK